MKKTLEDTLADLADARRQRKMHEEDLENLKRQVDKYQARLARSNQLVREIEDDVRGRLGL